MKTRATLGSLFLAGLIAAFVLSSGCSKIADSSKTKIRFFNAESLPQQIKMNEEIIRAFEKANPDIKIVYEAGASSGGNKILTEIAAGTPPDVFLYWEPLVDIQSRNALLSLNEYIEKYQVDLSQYWKGMVDLYTYDNQLYGMPLQLKTIALIYNKALFDAEGLEYPNDEWTWEDFYKAAKQLKKDLNGDGITDQFGCLAPYASDFLYMNGSRLVDEKARKSFLDRDQAAAKAMTFHRMLTKDTGPNDAEYQNMAGGAGTEGFTTGRVAMIIAPAWMLASFLSINSFEWGVASVPKGLDGNRYETFSAGAICVAKATPNPEAAARFALFYCGEKGMEIYTRYKNGIPAYKKHAYELFLAPPNEKLRPYVEAGERADIFANQKHVRNPSELWSLFWNEWGLVSQDKQTPVAALKKISDGVNKAIKAGNL